VTSLPCNFFSCMQLGTTWLVRGEKDDSSMYRTLSSSARRPVFFILALALMSAFPLRSLAQDGPRSGDQAAIDESESRAQQAADEMVALSPDRIIAFLQQEPGLLLDVKKALVRKAYEQGRILDPDDLTDDALFRLLWENSDICVLATQEIEKRHYIEAKPTESEMKRRGIMPSQGLGTGRPNNGNLPAGSQEQAYWSTHQPEGNRYPYPYPYETQSSGNQDQSSSYPYSNQQQQPYGQAPPQYGPPAPSQPDYIQNPSRSLEQAQSQSPYGLYSGGGSAPQNSGQMTRIQPEDLPALLSTDAPQQPLSTLNGGSGQISSSNSPYSLPNNGGLSGFDQQGWSNDPQQSRLQMPSRLPLPVMPDVPRQPTLRHKADPYADVPSLYDLYTQYSHSPVLQRFGEDVFHNGTGNFDQLPMDLPVGPDYVVGPGDGLSIDLWGGVSERLRTVVDREGRINLPEAGSVQVAGRTLGDVQHLVQAAFRSQFRDAEADVSLGRLRTVRVYVVGDVERPGAYDVSSLSTPLNAVFLAGGPTSDGSIRILKHFRGDQLIQQIDVYDLLLHGIRSDIQRLEPGDTVLVPPLGPEVTIEGMVRRPAIYELDGENTLAQVLQLAGGVLPSGTLRHVDVERVEAHETRTMLRLDIPENNNAEAVTEALQNFKIQDGDQVKISPILPYADKTVFLDGHVFRPGKYAYRDGMKVTDLIKSYADLLPEPSKAHAEIIRLEPPDYRPAVLTFNLGNALSGKGQDPALKPFDTVRIFSRYDFESPPVITISGEVRDPGDHLTNGATHLRDAIYLAGGTTPDASLANAQIFRKTPDGKLKVISVDLAKAMAGDSPDNILLEPMDRVFIHRDLTKLDPPSVTIQGEVGRPGKYPLGEGMTAAELVRVAGGFKRGAYTKTADLTSYDIENGQKVVGEHSTVPISEAMAGVPDTDVRLHDGDVLTIGTVAGWKDVGATIKLAGEVVHPGTYGIREGERLSSVIERAGGLREDAYPYGAIFERIQVMELQEHSRGGLIRDIQDQGQSLRLGPENDPAQKAAKEAALQQWQQALEEIQNTPPSGRMVIHISSKLKRWANTTNDVQVRDGDSLYIPKRPSTVMVDGSVYNPTAITYKPGKDASWYMRQAGGPTNMANKKAVFVIRADGSVVGGSSGLFSGGVGHTALQPGDMVMVPEKAFSANTPWKTTLEGAQLAYAIGIAIQVARSF
jgi:protein involved in polysaccharide export with SLBB domain